MQPVGLTGPELTALIAAITILAAIYITPPTVAFIRGHPQRWSITILSLAFGGTGIGWVAALIWAIQPIDPPEHLAAAEETEDAPFHTPSVSEELARLHQLLQTGAITQGEFDNLKMRLLG